MEVSMAHYTAKEAHELAMLNQKAINIAKGMVAQIQNEFYENGKPVVAAFSISPCYKSRAVSWIMQNYPSYIVTCNDIFSNKSIITISIN